MKKLGLIAAGIALIALVACSKKKPKTTPDETDTVEAEDPGPDTDTATPEAKTDSSDLDTAKANLGPVIYFEFDQAELSEESRHTLGENADWLKEDAKRTLLIEGHTDEVGTPEYNLGLGDRRARAARDYLIHLGIADERVKIITYGEERPVSNEDSMNRRSVFIATKK